MLVRYLRVEVLDAYWNSGWNIATIAEFKALVSGGTNVAQGKTATASGNYSGTPDAAINGVLSERGWMSQHELPNAGGTNVWWQVNLGATYDIVTVTIDCMASSSGYAALKSYRVMGSTDGVAFTKVGEKTNAPDGPKTDTLTLAMSYRHLIQDGTDIKTYGTGTGLVTWSPTDKGTNVTLSNGNLSATYSQYTGSVARTTSPRNAGKLYWELTVPVQGSGSYLNIGLSKASFPSATGYFYSQGADWWAYRIGPGVLATDVLAIALDMDAKKFDVYKNNTLIGTITNANISGDVYPTIGDDNGAGTTVTGRFNAPFTYTPPAGYSAFEVIGGWTTVGTAPVTEAMFTNSGMGDAALTSLNDAVYQQLVSSQFKVLSLGASTQLNLTAAAIPVAKVILPMNDIDISSVAQLNSVTLTATTAGGGDVKAVVSIDGGLTWKGFTPASTGVDQIPVTTGSTAAITASSNYSGYEPWRAFDNSNSTSWQTANLAGDIPAWIAYDFGVATTIGRYSMSMRWAGGQSYYPKAWQFQGWNGSAWVVLDSQNKATNDWATATPQSFTLPSAMFYTKYRIYITASFGSSYIDIGEVEFLSPAVTGGWATVAIANKADVKAKGMTPAVINAMTTADWATLLGSSSATPYSVIRFGYYLELNASTDTANTDKLAFNMNMQGTWDSTVNGTEYTYAYINSTELQVKIMVNGDYKINY